MILDAIIGAFLAPFRAMLSLIPSWSPNTAAIGETTASLGAQAGQLNGWFPVTFLGMCVATLIGYRIALLTYRLVTRVWELLPFT